MCKYLTGSIYTPQSVLMTTTHTHLTHPDGWGNACGKTGEYSTVSRMVEAYAPGTVTCPACKATR